MTSIDEKDNDGHFCIASRCLSSLPSIKIDESNLIVYSLL